MRYVIKAVKDFGAPYINVKHAYGKPTYRKTIEDATWFTSLVSAIDGIVEVNERGDAGKGELKVIGIEEIYTPRYREVEL